MKDINDNKINAQWRIQWERQKILEGGWAEGNFSLIKSYLANQNANNAYYEPIRTESTTCDKGPVGTLSKPLLYSLLVSYLALLVTIAMSENFL